jgi:hypothetical protein
MFGLLLSVAEAAVAVLMLVVVAVGARLVWS